MFALGPFTFVCRVLILYTMRVTSVFSFKYLLNINKPFNCHNTLMHGAQLGCK